MTTEDLEDYEAQAELLLYREYRDVAPMFRYVVETERRFYLANQVTQTLRHADGRTWIELELHDAWVWDMYRTNRFVASVTVVTVKDINIEEVPADDLNPEAMRTVPIAADGPDHCDRGQNDTVSDSSSSDGSGTYGSESGGSVAGDSADSDPAGSNSAGH